MPPPGTKSAVLTQVVSKTLSVVIVLGLSVVVLAYRWSLTPLYGPAPTDHHFNKVVWVACIVGSFAPTVSILPAVLVAGALLCLMPQTAYWVAVYTGRMGSPIWGPVATHLLVIAPVIALGMAIVKALQQTPEQQEATAPQQLITLPVTQTSIMTLQELWLVTPYIKDMTESQILLQAGSLALTAWAISPLLALPASEPVLPPASLQPQPRPQTPVRKSPSTPGSKAKLQQRKKASITKSPPARSAPQSSKPPTTTPASEPSHRATSGNLGRLLLLPILPFLTLTILQPPTLSKPLLEPYIHPTYPLRILSSVRSRYSGVIVVGEALPPSEGRPAKGSLHSMRYLRAGHSLLGGTWIGSLATVGRDDAMPTAFDEAGEPLGESIYDAFVLQEAVRLVEKPSGGARQNALFIGLGVGTSVSALMRHNVSTTIVELDPAVYDAAKRFFALPEPEPAKLFIKDARAWVRARARHLEQKPEAGEIGNESEGDEERYDIVVHDVFSGGSLPPYLFTQQFWNSTKVLMHPDGVLAVNLAGQLNSESSRAIILTLETIFGQCRALCDELDPVEQARNEYRNWVLFCSASSEPPTFRTAHPSDYLGSVQRAKILSTLRRREVDLTFIRESIPESQREQYIITDARNPLGKWQEKEALSHWEIMRQVLPDVFWETY